MRGRPAHSQAWRHGIDFGEAQELRNYPDRLFAPTRVSSEPRFLAIGRIGGRVWTAVFTWRGERVRIISVRRARKDEVERYEED